MALIFKPLFVEDLKGKWHLSSGNPTCSDANFVCGPQRQMFARARREEDILTLKLNWCFPCAEVYPKVKRAYQRALLKAKHG